MKALTICQPWAWAICEGLKPVENRDWPTSFRGRFLIHAGKNKKWLDEAADFFTDMNIQVPDNLTFGAVIGAATLVDCVRETSRPNDPWAFGPWCFVLADIKKFPKPVPMRGALGFFEMSIDEREATNDAGK